MRPYATTLCLALGVCAALAAEPPAKPLRVSFNLAQTDYEIGAPVAGQIVVENTSAEWVPLRDAGEMTKNLRLVAAGKEIAPKSPEQFASVKAKELGPGGLVGVTFDLALLFPQLAEPGAYSIVYKGMGAAAEPIPFRMLPAFDPAQAHRLSLKTDEGPVTIELFAKTAPVSVHNVVNLAHVGFYDGAEIARAEPGVMIAIRGPVEPRHRIPFERTGTEYLAGTVLLEAAGPDEARTSMPNLIVLLGPAPALEGRYTAVGQVVEGLDALRKLAARPTTGKGGAPPFKPLARTTIADATAAVTPPSGS